MYQYREQMRLMTAFYNHQHSIVSAFYSNQTVFSSSVLGLYLHWTHGFKYFMMHTQKTPQVTEYCADVACVTECTNSFGFTFWLPYCTELQVLMPSPTDCSYCCVLSVQTWKCNLVLSSQKVREQVRNNDCPV